MIMQEKLSKRRTAWMCVEQWQPGETYRIINGDIYVRTEPQEWVPTDLLEAYLMEEGTEEEIAKYELAKYKKMHPRKASGLTKKQEDELREVLLQNHAKKRQKRKERQPMQHAPQVEAETPTELPVLRWDQQYYNNTKIARIISTKGIPIEAVADTAKVTGIAVEINKKIINLVDLWHDQNITLSSRNITQFDMAVMDAAYTIMCSGYMVLTAEWIAKVLSGNPDARITPQKIGAIRKSIDKLRSTHIKIDCTQEFKSRKDTKKLKTFIYESYLLPLDKITAVYEANGKEVIAYPVLSKPALYRYAEILHQIIDIPAELINTSAEFTDTDEAILIKIYVIKRVAQIIANNNLHSNKISFQWYDKDREEERGLLPELGYTPDDSKKWRDKKQKINRIVKLTLKSLYDKNAIKGYEEYRADGTKNPASPIMGYRIFF